MAQITDIVVYSGVGTIVFVGILVELFYDPQKHGFIFRLRRFANWFPLGVTYGMFYMARYNIIFIIDQRVASKLGISNQDYGWILTTGFWTYAAVAPFTGHMADTYGSKKAFLFGCFGSGLTHLTMGFTFFASDKFSTKASTALLALFYSTGFIFQSFGTSCVSKLNSTWYPKQERALFGGIFGIVISCGFFLNLTIGNLIVSSMRWNYLWIITGSVLIFLGIVNWLVVTERPVSPDPKKVFPETKTVESEKPKVIQNECPPNEEQNKKKEPKTKIEKIKKWFVTYFGPILRSPTRYNTISLFSVGWIRESLLTWFLPFLQTAHGVGEGDILYSIASAGLSLASMTGAILLGSISTGFFNSRYPPAIALFFLILTSVLFFLLFNNPVVVVVFLILALVCSFGVNNTLSVTAIMDFEATKTAALAAGLITTSQYLAAGLSGFINGFLVDNFGYIAWLFGIIVFSFIGTLLMFYSSIITSKKVVTAKVIEPKSTPVIEPKSISVIEPKSIPVIEPKIELKSTPIIEDDLKISNV